MSYLFNKITDYEVLINNLICMEDVHPILEHDLFTTKKSCNKFLFKDHFIVLYKIAIIYCNDLQIHELMNSEYLLVYIEV